jgi:hypothetical protein
MELTLNLRLGAVATRLSETFRLNAPRYSRPRQPSPPQECFSLLGSECGKAYRDALLRGSEESKREKNPMRIRSSLVS